MIRWLSERLRCVPQEEMAGIHLDLMRWQWEVSAPRSLRKLFQALGAFLPAGAILYFEGGHAHGELASFFELEAVPEQTHVGMGTNWPRPQVFHVPATSRNLAALAALSQRCAEPELADHFHVYRGSEVLIAWFDILSIPMYVSNRFSEDEVASFCDSLGVTYRKFIQEVEQPAATDGEDAAPEP